MLRETREETGLTLTSYRFRGMVTFVSDEWEDEYMFLFTADEYEGEICECDEGVLEWIPKEQMYHLKLWEGDKLFLKRLEGSTDFFSLKVVYKKDELVDWKFF